MVELSSILNQENRFVTWADTVTYGREMSAEDKEISMSVDAWLKEIGKTGHDPNHEISAMVTKALTNAEVSTPSALVDAMFEAGSVGEFDDYAAEVEPINTIKVYEGGNSGTVDRSYIDHKVLRPKWVSLTAETDIRFVDIRKGGYKTVANLITNIKEALEHKKISKIFEIVDTAVTEGTAGCVKETAAMPTETSADALALYLADTTDGDTPIMFSQNKYTQAISKLAGATSYGSEQVKNQYNLTGFVKDYAGCELLGFSGQKKLPSGEPIVPDKRVFGISGRVGKCITRGEANVYQESDIQAEKIHIKVTGFTFGILINDLSKVGKIILN